MIIHEPWIRFNGLREKSKSETIEIFRHMEVSSLYFPPKKTLHWKYWNMPSPSTLKSSSLWCWRRCDPCSPDAPDGAHARRGLGHWISPDGIYWGFHGGIYWWFNGSYWDIPSGKLSHNYGKSPLYSCTQWPFSSSHSVNVYRRERSKIDMNNHQPLSAHCPT